MFPSNIISWAEASSGVPNHQVQYISRDHPANLTDQGALIIVKPSGKAPTHPKLVCIYKDKWTEVQWNTKTKTYTVGARVPQLDEYDTEGSDIQVLANEELEKTSEEGSASEAESEEELKEPGASINQQIRLAPIDQTLRTSPIEPKNDLPLPKATMTTQTTTSISMAITSSQPPADRSTSTTTPQKLHDQLQQILRRHRGGPGGPSGPNGPGGP